MGGTRNLRIRSRDDVACRVQSENGTSTLLVQAQHAQFYIHPRTCPNPTSTLVTVVDERQSLRRVARIPILAAVIGAVGVVVAALVAGAFTIWHG